jgi:hypothetical protein
MGLDPVSWAALAAAAKAAAATAVKAVSGQALATGVTGAATEAGIGGTAANVLGATAGATQVGGEIQGVKEIAKAEQTRTAAIKAGAPVSKLPEQVNPNILPAEAVPGVDVRAPGSQAANVMQAPGTAPAQGPPSAPPRPGMASRIASNPLTQLATVAGIPLAAARLGGDSGTQPRLPPTQAVSTGAAEAAERERKRRLGRGRASTILTSPQGVTGSSNVAVRKLLG